VASSGIQRFFEAQTEHFFDHTGLKLKCSLIKPVGAAREI